MENDKRILVTVEGWCAPAILHGPLAAIEVLRVGDEVHDATVAKVDHRGRLHLMHIKMVGAPGHIGKTGSWDDRRMDVEPPQGFFALAPGRSPTLTSSLEGLFAPTVLLFGHNPRSGIGDVARRLEGGHNGL